MSPRSSTGANNNGIPVILDAPTSKVSKALMKLAESIQAPTRPEPPKPAHGSQAATKAEPMAAGRRVEVGRRPTASPEGKPGAVRAVAEWRS